jgi:hypothetical protein
MDGGMLSSPLPSLRARHDSHLRTSPTLARPSPGPRCTCSPSAPPAPCSPPPRPAPRTCTGEGRGLNEGGVDTRVLKGVRGGCVREQPLGAARRAGRECRPQREGANKCARRLSPSPHHLPLSLSLTLQPVLDRVRNVLRVLRAVLGVLQLLLQHRLDDVPGRSGREAARGERGGRGGGGVSATPGTASPRPAAHAPLLEGRPQRKGVLVRLCLPALRGGGRQRHEKMRPNVRRRPRSVCVCARGRVCAPRAPGPLARVWKGRACGCTRAGGAA